jgi:hypothetical protein
MMKEVRRSRVNVVVMNQMTLTAGVIGIPLLEQRHFQWENANKLCLEQLGVDRFRIIAL